MIIRTDLGFTRADIADDTPGIVGAYCPDCGGVQIIDTVIDDPKMTHREWSCSCDPTL